MEKYKKPAVVFFSALALLVGLFVLFPSGVNNALASNGGGSSSSTTCGSTTTFYTYKASNFSGPGVPANFGPDFKAANVGDALTRFNQKKCEDPLWLAATEQFFADGEAMSQTKAQDRAALFVKDHAAWQQAADNVTKQIAGAALTTSDQRYDSLGMIPGAKPTDMPQLTKFAEQPVLNSALDITLPSGQHRLLRLDCDEQPSVVKFTQVAAPQPKEEKAPQPQQPQQVCTSCECQGNCAPVCTTCECAGNCAPACTTCDCQGNCPVPQCTTCQCTNTCLTPKGPSVDNGWTPLPSGPLTNGQQSQQQKQSGQTSGNVTDSKVPSGTTSGSTTPDLPRGTVTAPGAAPAPAPAPGSSPAPKDPYAGSSGSSGTGGATCQPDPFTGAGC